MEIILSLYALPYNEEYPVLCFHEQPCLLIGNAKIPIPMKKSQIAKQNYAYSKHGFCCVLTAIEPLIR